MNILGIILIIILSTVLHELGHYIACKIFKVKIEEVSLGTGVSLLNIKGKTGTEYHIRALPLSAYVTFDTTDYESLRAWKKIVIYSAGCALNLILSIVFMLSQSKFGMELNFILAGYNMLPFAGLDGFFVNRIIKEGKEKNHGTVSD